MLEENDKLEIKRMVDDGVDISVRFDTVKRGDTPTDDKQLTPKGWVDGQISSVISSISGVIASVVALIPSVAGSGIFADGKDGDITLDGTTSYTNFSSITVASSVYTLIRDVYANNLTVNNSVKLFPAGYIIYTKLLLTNNGFISRDGNAANGNTRAPVLSGGTLPSVIGGVDGGVGGAGGTGNNDGVNGVNGLVGTSTANSFFTSVGAAGGSGGSGGNSLGGGVGGAASGGASVTGYRIRPINPFNFESILDINADQTLAYYQTGPGSGSSGGGGGGRGVNPAKGGNGGNGAGTGGSGGLLVIYGRTIVNNGALTVLGGNGGNGANGQDGSVSGGNTGGGGGGGGGGQGGPGGILFYVTTSFTNNGSILTNGGTAGVYGNGGAGSIPGNQGNNPPSNFGNAGSVFGIII